MLFYKHPKHQETKLAKPHFEKTMDMSSVDFEKTQPLLRSNTSATGRKWVGYAVLILCGIGLVLYIVSAQAKQRAKVDCAAAAEGRLPAATCKR